MTEELKRLQAAAKRWRQSERTTERLRAETFALIVEAADGGVQQRDIVAATELSREHIRRIVKKAHDDAEAAAQG